MRYAVQNFKRIHIDVRAAARMFKADCMDSGSVYRAYVHFLKLRIAVRIDRGYQAIIYIYFDAPAVGILRESQDELRSAESKGG